MGFEPKIYTEFNDMWFDKHDGDKNNGSNVFVDGLPVFGFFMCIPFRAFYLKNGSWRCGQPIVTISEEAVEAYNACKECEERTRAKAFDERKVVPINIKSLESWSDEDLLGR